MARKREEDFWLSNAEKRRIRKEVKSRGNPESMTEVRKLKRTLRRKLHEGTFGEGLTNFNNPGKFISKACESTGRYKAAYRYARSEAEFYEAARYQD